MRVLIIEDNPDLAANIGDFLETRGHTPDFAPEGLSGLRLALAGEYDVIVLDLMLPGLDGLALCRRLREMGDRPVPVLMLTARDTLSDKLAGFDAGTDDYLVKPFALRELGARLEALVQRGTGRRRVLTVGNLELHTGTRTAYRQGHRLRLNGIRLRLLRRLMEASPNVVSKAELEEVLWADAPPDSNALSVHVYALRREMGSGEEHPLLETVHGVGYRLSAPESTP